MTANTSDNNRINREKQRWDEESSNYDAHHEGNWKHIYDEIAARVTAELSSESQIVELGCGTGLVTLRIAEHAKQVTAYDISDDMLHHGRQKAMTGSIPNVEFKNGDAYQIPEDDASFDIVLCCYLLDIIQDPSTVLKEARRLLRPGGILITVTDCYQDTQIVSAFRTLARKFKHSVNRILPSKAIGQIPSDLILMDLTRHAGFRITETAILDLDLEPEGLFNLCIKAKKLD